MMLSVQSKSDDPDVTTMLLSDTHGTAIVELNISSQCEDVALARFSKAARPGLIVDLTIRPVGA